MSEHAASAAATRTADLASVHHHLRAGAANIIPQNAEIAATVRAVSDQVHRELLDRARTLAEHIAQAHGLTAEVGFEVGYPATVNHADETALAQQIGAELFGPERWFTAPHAVLGSEDFSRVPAVVPGALVFIGECPPDIADPATAAPNHSPHARFDDALPIGAALLAGLALARLRSPADTANATAGMSAAALR